MLYIEIQPQNFFGSRGEDFYMFLPCIGIAAILLIGTQPFEQIVNTLLIKGHMWNLVKNDQAVSEQKTFRN